MKTTKDNPSILQKNRECFYCGAVENLDRHEFLSGSNRRNAAYHGLWVYVCRLCHSKIQNNATAMDSGRRMSQAVFEDLHGHDEYMKIFGRSYL